MIQGLACVLHKNEMKCGFFNVSAKEEHRHQIEQLKAEHQTEVSPV